MYLSTHACYKLTGQVFCVGKGCWAVKYRLKLRSGCWYGSKIFSPQGLAMNGALAHTEDSRHDVNRFSPQKQLTYWGSKET